MHRFSTAHAYNTAKKKVFMQIVPIQEIPSFAQNENLENLWQEKTPKTQQEKIDFNPHIRTTPQRFSYFKGLGMWLNSTLLVKLWEALVLSPAKPKNNSKQEKRKRTETIQTIITSN